MEHKKIISYDELLLSIAQLKAERYHQEKMLQDDIQQFISSINPVAMVKETAQKLAGDHDVRNSLIKIGLGIGSSVIINQLTGKYRIMPVILGIKLIEKIAGLFGKRNRSKIEPLNNRLLSKNTPAGISGQTAHE
ncbi:MAG: hypothetical protein Q8S18_01780 [Bacteroidales bacterium]|nr:hypothetical protein [Bacteroidales bacterium]